MATEKEMIAYAGAAVDAVIAKAFELKRLIEDAADVPISKKAWKTSSIDYVAAGVEYKAVVKELEDLVKEVPKKVEDVPEPEEP